MPCISRPSVIISPLNPNSFCSRSVTIFFDTVEGVFGLSSNAGTSRCPTIIAGIFFLISSLNGYNSIACNLSLSCVMSGKS